MAIKIGWIRLRRINYAFIIQRNRAILQALVWDINEKYKVIPKCEKPVYGTRVEVTQQEFLSIRDKMWGNPAWETILRKDQNFRRAYDNFDIAKIANYGEAGRQRLLNDSGIIRNLRKIDSIIHNAKVLMGLGSFDKWFMAHHPLSKGE
ncbi:MAG: DNA-3-methyladenine glycosylase I [Clostridiales bacterium]|nr:DNA-3-methyladenine glycosylase I [Clostridiales bacterium]